MLFTICASMSSKLCNAQNSVTSHICLLWAYCPQLRRHFALCIEGFISSERSESICLSVCGLGKIAVTVPVCWQPDHRTQVGKAGGGGLERGKYEMWYCERGCTSSMTLVCCRGYAETSYGVCAIEKKSIISWYIILDVIYLIYFICRL
jgi:hypothetical protein